MAFSRPSLQDLVERIQADFVSRLDIDGEPLRRSVIATLSRVMAGATHMLHGHLEYISKQIFPDVSEQEFLERQAALFDITRLAATFASGNVTFEGTNGTDIPGGTLLQRSDGAQYTTDATVTIASGEATAAVTAVTAGAAGEAVAGVALSIVSPIAGITNTLVVATGGLTGGADPETDESLRSRVIARMQAPPHGGASFDYVAWAKEVVGVTRAWVYPQELGPGTVTVRFVRDGDASIIPDGAEVTAVQDYIDAVRPVTANVTVVAPVSVPLNFTIDITPDTGAVRAAIEQELRDLLSREAEPGGTILISHIREAISVAAGETDHSLTVPNANVTHTTGQIATFGAITWL